MYNPSLSGNAGNSAANNRLFVYEVIGLRDMQVNAANIRTSGTTFITVAYTRMGEEMRRIARLGGTIVNIRPLAAVVEPSAENPEPAKTEAAPAFIAAIPTMPEPDATSTTRLPRTVEGVSKIYRDSACPPAQAKAQNGGGRPISPNSSSVFCQIGKASWAR